MRTPIALLMALALAGCPEDGTGTDPGGGDTAAGADSTDSSGGGDAGPDVVIPVGPEWDELCTAMMEPSNPNCFTQDYLFECTAETPPGSTPARLRRISKDELTRASGMRLTSELGQNPFEAPPTLPFSSYDQGVTIDATTLDLYLSVIDQPGRGWTARDAGIRIRHTYDGDPYKCMWTGVPDDDCRDLWVNGFMELGMLFRPPTIDEAADLRALLDEALDAEASNGLERQQTMSQVVSAAWLMPGALFRYELGEETGDEFGRHRLTDAELGKAIAFALTHRGPGATASFHFGAGPGGDSWTGPAEGYLGGIRAAVADGTIQQPDTIKQLIRDYAGGVDPERNDLNVEQKLEESRLYRGDWWVATKIRDFFREWLGYATFPTDFKDTAPATSKYTLNSFDLDSIDGLGISTASTGYGNLQSGFYGDEPAMVAQMDDLIARVVIEDSDVFRKLLTTRTWFVPSTGPGDACTDDSECASVCLSGRCYGSTWKGRRFMPLIYGIEGHIEPTDEGRWVEVDPTERAGVLTHPAWLASHGDFFEDGPSVVHRGKWVREKLFCQYIPPLTAVQGIEAQLLPGSAEKSARARMMESIESRSECMWCHQRMNSLGYPFEQYNHAGYVRGWDHDPTADAPDYQGAVDASTTLMMTPDPALAESYDNAIDYVEALANSPVAKRCFIRQTFRYFVGRDEKIADACTLNQMEAAYDENGSFLDMLGALMTSDTFLYRTQNPDAVCE